MAIFGAQLCFTLIAASFMQKLTPIYSFSRWLLCGGHLVRYKPPTDSELKKLHGKSESKKGRKNGITAEEVFKVPKKVPVILDVEPLRFIDVVALRYYSEYKWLVDYFLYSVLVYAGTEVYYFVRKPSSDFNLSMIWLTLSCAFALRSLLSVLWLYAKSKAGGELSLSIAFAMISFIVSLAVLILKGNSLDFVDSFPQNSTISQGNMLDSSRFQLILAVASALLGLLFIFPAIRMAQMYVDALKYASGNIFVQAGLHANFFAPTVLCLLWFRPVTDALMYESGTGISSNQIEISRIILVLLTCLLRIVMMRTHIQAYLNLAHDRVMRLQKESGTILNTDLQRLVAQVFYYLGVVAVQYFSPIVLLTCSALFLKTLGGYSWQSLSQTYEPPVVAELEPRQYFGDAMIKELIGSLEGKLPQVHAVFSPAVVRSVMSYVLWWCISNWFAASCVGLFYHWYLVD